ncbi:MAG: DUF488 domain-containing protein [Desulfohalobiaceae bacterium]|nr:DUF488 domain-containing protein [Desulfohalobiaceae bacterium]
MKTIYTIGYSSYQLDTFVQILKKHGINTVADVRSSPYSAYRSDFNKVSLQKFLQKHDITYVFMGNQIGARWEDPEVYIDGVVDYDLISNSSTFQEGLDRIRAGSRKYVIALMCAEKDPITCHRTILISKNLRNDFFIQHILEDGSIEKHKDLEKRLLRMHTSGQLKLPGLGTTRTSLDDAYKIQESKIAYRLEVSA